MRITRASNTFFALIALTLFSACSTISPFSQKAYEQATSLKAEALIMMDKATQPYSDNKQAVDELKLNLEKAYEYAKGRPQNTETTLQWAIIKDPARNSLGGFLKRWESRQTLNKEFIDEVKALVADGFDTVIELESGKRKPSDGQK